MDVFLFLSIIIGSAGQNIAKKAYSKKCDSTGVYFFSVMTSIGALAFFAFTSTGFSPVTALLPYSAAFALCYIVTIVCSTKAMSCGPLPLSSLVISYSLMLPTFYGLIFLKDSVEIGLVPGILLLIISLIFINKKDDSKNISAKWLFLIFLAFLGNGTCSIIQKMQQLRFVATLKNEFMIIALLLVAVVSFLLSMRTEKQDVRVCVKKGWGLALLCGAMNGFVNSSVMLLYSRLQISYIFPIISSGSIIVAFIVSRFIYREHLTRMQLLGLILGICSVICLNL